MNCNDSPMAKLIPIFPLQTSYTAWGKKTLSKYLRKTKEFYWKYFNYDKSTAICLVIILGGLTFFYVSIQIKQIIPDPATNNIF